MSKRKETPDVLGNILGGPEEPEKQPARKTARQKARKPEKRPEDDPKIKATHYLRQSTLYRLEEALIQLPANFDEVVAEAAAHAMHESEGPQLPSPRPPHGWAAPCLPASLPPDTWPLLRGPPPAASPFALAVASAS